MDEFSLIDELIVPRAGQRDDVVLGIGDDGAIVSPPPGEELVIVADTSVAGVHFPIDLPPADIGYRAVAVNLSDIAAMGADPRWATLALTLPVAERDWLTEFMQGLGEALAEHGVQLVGGDTTRGPLTITVQITGSVPRGQALTRHGARPGDVVFVSGPLGDAAAGLALHHRGQLATETDRALLKRFARPSARLALGRALRNIATSCIDVSDGLVADLGHIAEKSGVGATIDISRLPLSAALRATDTFSLSAAREFALTGGDDYELCFTLREVHRASVEALSRLGFELHAIGTVTAQKNGVVVLDDFGQPKPVTRRGYQHF